MKFLCFLFLGVVIVGTAIAQSGPDEQFVESFSPVLNELENITAADVKSTLSGIGYNTTLLSEITDLDYFETNSNGDECRILFIVDKLMDKLTITHYEGNSAEEHYLFNGGCPNCIGAGEFRQPMDVAHSSSSWVNPSYWYHYIFVADYGNHRIVPMAYKTHIYDVAGHRLNDYVTYEAPFGSTFLRGPTGVAILPGISSELYVADREGGMVFRFSKSGEFRGQYGASDFGVSFFKPFKIALLESNSKKYVGVLSRRVSPISGEIFDNVVIGEDVNGSITPIFSGFFEGAIDIEASDELGFVVLSEYGVLHRIGVEGGYLNDFSFSGLGLGISEVTCISGYRDNIALGFDYDNDSGFGVYEKTDKIIGIQTVGDTFFNKFDSFDFSVQIDFGGDYDCYIRSEDGDYHSDLWQSDHKTVGNYELSWDCEDCPEGSYTIRVRDASKTTVYAAAQVELSHGPLMEINSPERYDVFLDGATVFLDYDIVFSNNAVIDSTVLYFSRGSAFDRCAVKPGDQDERGNVQFRFYVPLITEESCSYHYYLDLFSYCHDGETVIQSHETIDPYVTVICDKDQGEDPYVPCIFPCGSVDKNGDFSFVNGKKIFVRTVGSGFQLEAYVASFSPSDLKIFDVRGRLVAERTIDSMIGDYRGAIFSVSDLRISAGVYFAKVGKGTEFTTKFVLLK